MRQARYLNVILTVNAVLLAALLWTQIAGSSIGSQAVAQQPPTPGIPNAASQRQAIIDSIDKLRASVEDMHATIESGDMRVTVANIDEISSGGDGG